VNKSELIQEMAKQTGRLEKETAAVVNTILDTMAQSLAEGNGIEIRGFGSFSVKEYDAYTGRNPKTGGKVEVGAKKLPVFKVGKGLMEAVDAGRRSK